MSLFQKKPSLESSTPAYVLDFNSDSTGIEEKILIIGLGNPGKEYNGTRHNIGFEVLDGFAEKEEFPGWMNKKDLKGQINMRSINGKKIILLKPSTFMNLSGEAVQLAQNFYKIDNSKTLVIHDELDVNFGFIRIRGKGKDAGHNGIKSVINQIGDEFARLRIGIGPKQPGQIDSSDFVLKKFTTEEQKHLSNLAKEAVNIINEYIFSNGNIDPETRKFIY
ncbi:aminoacyl-tRNA hydrolase [Candidatus Saccharibacteria bacterium]|nr:aminoacyl-tRNA hydrolase [Candidatus Saccharibacteria bacterium]